MTDQTSTDARAMPNGTERPGEHWNARLVREEAERAADAAPYDAEDAPVATTTPLPVHDELKRARAGRDLAVEMHDAASAAHLETLRELQQARATITSQAEQLRRNGTLLCRLRDLDEQRDRAWTEHDTLGRPTCPRCGDQVVRLVEGGLCDECTLDDDQGAALGSPPTRAQGISIDGLLANVNRSLAAADTDDERAETIEMLLDGWYAAWPSGALASPHAPLAAELVRMLTGTSAQGPDGLTDRLAAALDTWAQAWHRRRLGHGATPAQHRDIDLLAAYDAHRSPTADRLDQGAVLRPADWEQKATAVAQAALAETCPYLGTDHRDQAAAQIIRAIIDVGLVGHGGRCPRCQQPYPRTVAPGTPDTDRLCWTCTTDSDQPTSS